MKNFMVLAAALMIGTSCLAMDDPEPQRRVSKISSFVAEPTDDEESDFSDHPMWDTLWDPSYPLSPIVLTNLDLSGDDLSQVELSRLSFLTNLKCLNLSGCNLDGHTSLSPLTTLSKLEVLKVGNNPNLFKHQTGVQMSHWKDAAYLHSLFSPYIFTTLVDLETWWDKNSTDFEILSEKKVVEVARHKNATTQFSRLFSLSAPENTKMYLHNRQGITASSYDQNLHPYLEVLDNTLYNPVLISIRLRPNHMESIVALSNLTEIDLSHCQLDCLHNLSLLLSLPKLKTLNLAYNKDLRPWEPSAYKNHMSMQIIHEFL